MKTLKFFDGEQVLDVLEWRVYYPNKVVYCSCQHKPDDLPLTGVQGIGYFFWKDGAIRCHNVNGMAEHPAYYYLGYDALSRKRLRGTELPDDEWEELEKWMYHDCHQRLKHLRSVHGST